MNWRIKRVISIRVGCFAVAYREVWVRHECSYLEWGGNYQSKHCTLIIYMTKSKCNNASKIIKYLKLEWQRFIISF